MLNLCKKMLTIVILTFTATTVHANDAFSHAVLSLLDDPRNEEAWSMVINSQEDWESFYNQPLAYMSFLAGTIPTAPVLDFENYQILAGGLGMQSHGGAFLTVETVQELENSISVHVLLVRPGPDCTLPAVISYPSTAILIKKTDKPFSFSVSNLIDECTVPEEATTTDESPDVNILIDPDNQLALPNVE
ncbi:MAG: hypothetical protein methR_P2154 [Methyloprofundus sp.]|nr:MAG: hypothetical protein methR_P2154 [Methyloprofundus sp.]